MTVIYRNCCCCCYKLLGTWICNAGFYITTNNPKFMFMQCIAKEVA